ncbi:response regulator [Burkholderiaceae bacterium DAT-1]|nr:response regulator [Burkholderiaceae bacterium DAT-1]
MALNGKITFVVIDDDKLIRTLVQGILKDMGIDMLASCETAEAGLHDVRTREPDLVILDINLPGADGLSVLKELKSGSRPPKVIMMTAEATISRVQEALKHQADGFIVKPFTAGKLESVIAAAVRSLNTD